MSVYVPSHIRAARRMSAFILFVLGVSLTVGLYYIKTRAQTARKAVVTLERMIEDEEASLRVLRAEAAFLEGPARLMPSAQEHLGHAPIKIENVIRIDDIDSVFALKEGEGE